ncbi:hypothetical protein phiOC_p369 [Ochrobactrum phage vB_OspM_OC]|nr:hypothetical protein phiOC_p369 [Ochrobactrum phage vB_OspM_OC]
MSDIISSFEVCINSLGIWKDNLHSEIIAFIYASGIVSFVREDSIYFVSSESIDLDFLHFKVTNEPNQPRKILLQRKSGTYTDDENVLDRLNNRFLFHSMTICDDHFTLIFYASEGGYVKKHSFTKINNVDTVELTKYSTKDGTNIVNVIDKRDPMNHSICDLFTAIKFCHKQLIDLKLVGKTNDR